MNTPISPLVSIVVPAYNEEANLAECLDSILAQSYKNWNCTIVDNCSTDRSTEIASRYAARDSRIRLHTNASFLTAVANHNAALRLTSPDSKYCKIVFADDWIFPECIERMVSYAEQHTSVGIVGAYGLQGGRIMWSGLPYQNVPFSGRDICRRLFLDDLYVFGTSTSLLFRSDLVRSSDPFYDEANIHSDSETCIALLKEWDFGFVHQVLTVTRERPNSLSTISIDRNTLIAARLYELIKYGPFYLTPPELRACLKRKTSEYYDYLGRSVMIGRRDKAFWAYHKAHMARAGVVLNGAHLALAAVTSTILHPRGLLQDLRARRAAEKGRSALSALPARCIETLRIP